MKYAILIIFLATNRKILGQKDSAYSEKGTASYYAKKFEGRRCSNGDIFRNDSLTAAHKKLKFGTLVKVTNLANDSAVVVKINDRLPKRSRCKIDLTRRAAKQLNFIKKGVTKVKIDVVGYSQDTISVRTDRR